MTSSPCRILLLEDQAMDARLFRRTMRPHEVVWVQTVEQAVMALLDEVFDIAVVDLHVGDEPPERTVERALAAAGETPVIVLTGVDDTQLGTRLIRAGAHDYVAKSELSGPALARRVLLDAERARARRGAFRRGAPTMPRPPVGPPDAGPTVTVRSAHDPELALVDTALVEDGAAAGRADSSEQWQSATRDDPRLAIAGRYCLRRALGSGSAGTVFLSLDLETEEEVALKLMHDHLVESEEMRRRFLLEAATQAALRHPNILQVLDSGDCRGRCFIVSHYAEFGSLSRVLGRRRFGFGTLARLLLPLVDGVAYAHAHGVVHRDIKPANVLVARSEGRMVVQLGDFGVARLMPLRSSTRTGSVVGTLRYVAPEQYLDAKRADHRADIFSLGATLYEAFTGRAIAEPGWNGQRSAVPRADGVARGVPEEVGSLLERAMALDPEERPATCEAFAADLRRCIRNHSESGRWETTGEDPEESPADRLR